MDIHCFSVSAKSLQKRNSDIERIANEFTLLQEILQWVTRWLRDKAAAAGDYSEGDGGGCGVWVGWLSW